MGRRGRGTRQRRQNSSKNVVVVENCNNSSEDEEEEEEEEEEGRTTRGNCFGLPEAPIFYPTEEEFIDPLRFIAKIRQQVEELYGICRIVPPQSWRPPFALDSSSFTFPTKIQAIHQLQERPAACDADTFKLEYRRYLKGQKRGGRTTVEEEEEEEEDHNWPQFEGEDLDLCKLFNAVKRHGGYLKVRDENRWGEVFRMLKSEEDSPPAVPSSSAVLAHLCELYKSHLYSYEVYQANVRSGKLVSLRNPKTRGQQQKEIREVNCKGEQADRKRHTQIELGVSRKRQRSRSNLGRSSSSEDATDSKKHVGGSGGDDSSDLKHVGSGGKDSSDPHIKLVIGSEEHNRAVDQICKQCHSGVHEKLMLLCARCNRGWHLYCLSPPLSTAPHGNWYCLDCVASSDDCFGFVPGNEYSYIAFEKMAERFKHKWFGSRCAEFADVEKELWQIVERATAPVEVLYGSDIDTGVYGSGFPRDSDAVRNGCDVDEWAAYTNNPWNLNNFPKLRGSMLRMVQDNIPGVIVPWLYVGMLFSSFCWHYEDHCFYSVNYLHHGAAKTWYSVPGSAASDFEKVMQKAFPDLFEAQPDLLFQLVTMLNPEVVQDSGVPVCTTVQEPGHFVITFPRSYHGGFNHGFNCAEAVNFAPADWLPMGGWAVERYRFYHKAAVLSHDELLCIVAKNEVTPGAESFIQQELRGIVMKERAQREQLWSSGVVKSTRMAPRACQDCISMEEDPECIICQYYLHLSAVVCGCCPARAVCLQHAKQLCECPTDHQRLLYRYSLAELNDLLSNRKTNPEGDIKMNGRKVGLSELATEWLTKAQNELKQTPTLAAVKELLTEVEQFLWAGHEMDPVRVVERTLIAAHTWGEEVVQCWTTVSSWLQAKESSRPIKVSFLRVQQLVTIDPVPCAAEPHLAFLKRMGCLEQAFFGTAQCMQQQIAKFISTQPLPQVLQDLIIAYGFLYVQSESKKSVASAEGLRNEEEKLMRPKRENLEALLKEANHFPVEFAELPSLQRLVSLAKTWSERVRKLLPPIKALRSHSLVKLDQLLALQAEGLSLPLKMEDKQMLDLVIKKTLTLKGRVAVMLGSVAPLQELEVVVEEVHGLPVQVPGLHDLEQRLAHAHAWLVRARTTLANIRSSSDFGASITLLTDLLSATSTIHVQMDEVNTTQVTLRNIQWMDLASKTIAARPSTKAIQYLLNEATRLQIGEEKLVLHIRELAEAALCWESKAEQALKHGESFDNCVKLISVASNINARLEGLAALESMVAQASSFRERAFPFVCKRLNAPGADANSHLQLSTLQALVDESKELKVRLEEVSLLHTYSSHAEAWARNASTLKASAVKALFMVEEGDEPSGYDFSKSTIVLEKLLWNLQEAVKDGLTLGLGLPVIEELVTLCDDFTWSIRASHSLHTQSPLEEMESLLNERSSLSETRQGALLQRTVLRARSWLQKVAAIVPSYGYSSICSEGQLEQLLDEAQNLPVFLDNDVSQIHQLLAVHRTWKEQVCQALSCNENYLTQAELLHLQEEGRANQIKSDLQQHLSVVLASADAWLSTCHKAISSQSNQSSMTLKELLFHMVQSVERACQRVEGEEVGCICGGTSPKADSSMLHCGSCEEWYHPKCFGLSQLQTRGHKQDICPFCTALSTGILAFVDDNPLKMHVTHRPSLLVIMELFESANSIHCRLDEQEMLQELITAVHAWEVHVSGIIEPAIVLRDNSTPVDVCSLRRVVKAIGTLEVQPEVIDRVKAAVATNAWRTHAINLLERPGKLSLRCTTKLIREGLAISVHEDDYVLQDLKYLESCGSNWTTRAKQVIGDQGGQPVEKLRSLIVEGKKLPVLVGKELSVLRTQIGSYCVCQKPYDEQLAMIACDHCGEWYHYSCLQLPEPEEESGDGDLPHRQHNSEDFICPGCQDEPRHVRTHLHCEEVDPLLYKHYFEESSCKVEIAKTPTVLEVPRAGSRGKRSSRAKMKAMSQHKWQYSHVLKGSSSESREGETDSSGRPCRRTAGRDSGFYLLLMHSC